MSGKPWFRVYADMPDNPKIGMLDDAAHRCWIECLCFAAQQGESGRVGTLKEINWKFRRDYSEQLKTLVECDAMRVTGDVFYVSQWRHRQYESDSSRSRTQKYRDRKKTDKTKGDVTSQERHIDRHRDAPRADTDTDISTVDKSTSDIPAPEKPKRPPNPKPTFSPPDWVDPDAWAAWMEVRKKAKAVNSDYALNCIVADLERFRQQGHDPTELVKTAVKGGWKSVYEPKNHGASRHAQPNHHHGFLEEGERLIAECRAEALRSGQGAPDSRAIADLRAAEEIWPDA